MGPRRLVLNKVSRCTNRRHASQHQLWTVLAQPTVPCYTTRSAPCLTACPQGSATSPPCTLLHTTDPRHKAGEHLPFVLHTQAGHLVHELVVPCCTTRSTAGSTACPQGCATSPLAPCSKPDPRAQPRCALSAAGLLQNSEQHSSRRHATVPAKLSSRCWLHSSPALLYHPQHTRLDHLPTGLRHQAPMLLAPHQVPVHEGGVHLPLQFHAQVGRLLVLC